MGQIFLSWICCAAFASLSQATLASPAFPGRLGEAIDIDKSEIISRRCVDLTESDMEFIPPNIGEMKLGYDYTASELRKRFGIEASAALSLGGISIEGSFKLHLKAAKTRFSSTVVISRLASGGELRIKPDSVLKLNRVGQIAKGSADARYRRDLCGQGYVRSISLASGFVGVLKIDYRSKASFINVGAMIQLEMPTISVGGSFEVLLNELKKHGDVSLHLYAWGGDIGSLGRAIQGTDAICSLKQEEDIYASATESGDTQTQEDKTHCLLACNTTGETEACQRVLDGLVEYSESYFVNDFVATTPELAASYFAPVSYRMSIYEGNVVDEKGKQVETFSVEGLDAYERMNVSVLREQIEFEIAENSALAQRARDLLNSHYILSQVQRAKLREIIDSADAVVNLAKDADRACAKLIDSDLPCEQKEYELAQFRDRAYGKIDLLALTPPPMGFETWCQSYVNAYLPDRELGEEDDPSAEFYISQYHHNTIASIIDTYNLTGTGETLDTILSRTVSVETAADIYDLNCREIADRALSLVEISLAGANIYDLTPLYGLNQVRNLDLSGNQSDLLTPDIAHFEFLRELDLTNTHTKRLSDIKRLPFLKKLNVSETDVVTLGELSGHPSIEEVDASFSKVRSLSLNNVPWLHRIDLRGTAPRDLMSVLQNNSLFSLEEVVLSESIASSYNGLTCNEKFGEHILITCVSE